MIKHFWQLILGSVGVLTAVVFIFSFKNPDTSAENPAPPPAPEGFPTDYFASPVEDPIRLTGTFGELRPDHFHSGIDIKSKNGGVGQPVLAAADGFLDRIKVQAGGYGNVIYLKHPNGYITVYAHLDKFSPELAKYVKEGQYKKERFEIELNPKDGQFRFKKGEEIGKLGNSGSSSGPHLHFEIRRASDDKVLDPLLFGLPVPDTEPPQIRDFKIYLVNDSKEVTGIKNVDIVKSKDGTYRLKTGDTLKLGAWRAAFGVKAYDQMSGFKNDNGITGIAVTVDGQTEYRYKMDALDFGETRYINAHMDYHEKQLHNAYFHRCFIMPGNKLDNYPATGESKGIIPLYKENPRKVQIRITDSYENASDLIFWIQRSEPVEPPVQEPYHYFLPFDQDSKIITGDMELTLPKGLLYENLYFQYHTSPDFSSGIYSSVHHLHHDDIPAHKYMSLSILADNVPMELRSKAIIARCESNSKPVNCGGDWKGNYITTRTRSFGDYCIMTDTEAPSIVPVVFDDDMRKKSQMSFRINDNFGISGMADGLYYRGTIDGNWVLFEFDSKKDRLTYVFDGRVGTGTHTLKLIVRDDRGNENVFERTFIR